jgi:hypothetical protein
LTVTVLKYGNPLPEAPEKVRGSLVLEPLAGLVMEIGGGFVFAVIWSETTSVSHEALYPRGPDRRLASLTVRSRLPPCRTVCIVVPGLFTVVEPPVRLQLTAQRPALGWVTDTMTEAIVLWLNGDAQAMVTEPSFGGSIPSCPA